MSTESIHSLGPEGIEFRKLGEDRRTASSSWLSS